MSVNLSNYDIFVYRGNTYKLDFSYTDNNTIGIDLSDYEAKLQIRRTPDFPYLLAELTESFPTGSFGVGLSGDFSSGSGVTGYTGGLILNYDGITGDVHIQIDSETTYGIPVGKHSYDLQLKNMTTGTQITILRGRFESLDVSRIISRSSPTISGEGLLGGSG
tara:strand:- start:447 stop:935 length:489 start_codon:yes stop_codon:yes gene_type:complete